MSVFPARKIHRVRASLLSLYATNCNSMTLFGRHVRLEPLSFDHIDGLVAAANEDHSLYRWSPVPSNAADFAEYVRLALAWRDTGTAEPFAIVRANDNVVIGSTRFFNLERWSWPRDHASAAQRAVDGCEIGYSWLSRQAIRTAANTEAKLLMLTHAFESWRVFRVCFHADARNERSQRALEHLGARFEGVLRSHRLAVDLIPRDSWRYSIVAAEWPAVKQRLTKFMEGPRSMPAWHEQRWLQMR